jgi:membrane-bound ClpP family serine protease
MARCLQNAYSDGKVIVFVHAVCKSAGTLLALAAHELILSDDAELGPLDVQLRKPDEIDERTSGLTAMQAMQTLRSEAYQSFEQFFVTIRRRTRITTKTAAELATKLTVGRNRSRSGQE